MSEKKYICEGVYVEPDGGLCGDAWLYCLLNPLRNWITLDGDFTPEQLKAIAEYMLSKGEKK